jgi:hypothetical protein
MADTTTITGDSQEAVAMRLCEMILSSTGKKPVGNDAIKTWILDSYKECLQAVRHPEPQMKVAAAAVARARGKAPPVRAGRGRRKKP